MRLQVGAIWMHATVARHTPARDAHDRRMTAIFTALGTTALAVATDAGGMALIAGRAVKRLFPPRLDTDELWRSMGTFGYASLPIVLATAAFTGAIMVVQGALYVEQFGVYNLVGWYTGFSTFREVGPVLVGLMFSGRVGANNTSELATMRVTEQLDALRILAIDVYELLVLPRTVAMIVSLTALVVFADLFAVLAGALTARLLLGLDYSLFLSSLLHRLEPGDFLTGVAKAVAFGGVIAVVSTHFGVTARGGSTGVGRAVNAQVVGCAAAIFLVDYILTSVLR
jgi:phospholipid/cholesterol/gamma-HCH transport system permease protein